MMSAETQLDGATLVVRIPLRFQCRGGRKRIVAPDGSEIALTKPQPDGTLVKALARAWRWQRLLDDGVYTRIGQTRRRRADQPLLRLPRPAPYAPRARHRRSDPRRAADGRSRAFPETVPARMGEAAGVVVLARRDRVYALPSSAAQDHADFQVGRRCYRVPSWPGFTADPAALVVECTPDLYADVV